MLFEAGGNGSEMLDLVEEAFDEIAISVEERAERRNVDASRHGFDVRPGAALGQAVSEGVAVMGAIGEQGLSGAKAIQHIAGASAVMGLALGELEGNRIAVGVDQGVDLGRRSAARAPMHRVAASCPWPACGGPLF